MDQICITLNLLLYEAARKQSLKGVAGHTFGVTKNLLEIFLTVVAKMKVLTFFVYIFLTMTSLGEDSARG